MKKATWIWYYGDFEVWQHLLLSIRRDEKGGINPVFWRLDDCCHSVVFKKKIELLKEESIRIYSDGVGVATINGCKTGFKDAIMLEKGTNEICVSIANPIGLPSMFIEGETVFTDSTWLVTNNDGKWVEAGSWDFYDKDMSPSSFKLPTKQIPIAEIKKQENEIFIDAGCETFCGISLRFSAKSNLCVHYGESVEEALSDNCCIYEKLTVEEGEYTLKARAFRFVNIKYDGAQPEDIKLFFEYLPLEYKGSFKCSDQRLDQIWDVAAYTLFLNSREFFIDGIKRDRWVWSGDACQCYLMNHYLFFDNDICKRTILALRGKEPVMRHINTILDYSFYWFISIYDYFMFTGDIEFVKRIYPKMVTLMEFCLSRLDENGLAAGKAGDWVFIDWADIDKTGAACAEQMLFAKSLESMKLCCDLAGQDGAKYECMAKSVKEKIQSLFWNEKAGAFIDSFESGKSNVTRHANIFALLFDYADQDQRDKIIKNVLLNKNIPEIKTPYFKFYELEAMCNIVDIEGVTKQILKYWGGMLDLGATSFWEEYDPNISGAEQYKMYGDEFGKSLCHAWGASPIYIIGKYYLGVKPTSPGYETFEVNPNLGGLSWFEGVVPINGGEVRISMSESKLEVVATKDGGILKYKSGIYELIKNIPTEISIKN